MYKAPADINEVQVLGINSILLKGTYAERITIEHLSINGNEVIDVKPNADGTSTTVVFRDSFISGKEQILTVQPGDGIKKEFKFTYIQPSNGGGGGSIQDTTPPIITLEGIADLVNEASQSLQVTTNEKATVTVKVDGNEVQSSVNSTYELTLIEGSNTIEVTATDMTGNASTTTKDVTLDTVNPKIESANMIAEVEAKAATTEIDFGKYNGSGEGQEKNKVIITSTTEGTTGNGITIKVVDDVTTNTDESVITYDTEDKVLKIDLKNNTEGSIYTTILDFVKAINNSEAQTVLVAEPKDPNVSENQMVAIKPLFPVRGIEKVTAGGVDYLPEKLELKFSEKMKPTTLDDITEITIKDESLGTNPIFVWDSDAKVLDIVLGEGHTISEGDTIIITASSATDVAGNLVELDTIVINSQ